MIVGQCHKCGLQVEVHNDWWVWDRNVENKPIIHVECDKAYFKEPKGYKYI
jgi:hypothetical protein